MSVFRQTDVANNLKNFVLIFNDITNKTTKGDINRFYNLITHRHISNVLQIIFI